MKQNEVAVRKRTQIASANRTMFLWIAAASALIGATVVVGIFLFQQLVYNEKVLFAKQETASTLQKNNAAVGDLKQEILVLDTNTDLAKAKANPEDQALQVILDALPSDANTLALGASLQNKLLTGIPGLQPIESMTVTPISTDDEEVVAVEAEGEAPSNAISFSFTITGTQDSLKLLLDKLERSIRTIEIVTLRFETQQNGELLMNVSARAFYEPARTIELEEKVIPR